MKRKAICMILALCIAISCMTFSGIAASAKTAEPAETGAVTDYSPAEKCQDGNILHCFNWTLNQIKEELPKIAQAGFTSVQTSPLQGHNGNYQWYWLYQPTNFTVGNELGSLDDLKSLCREADKYGIKIIVDVVANHLAGSNNGSWSGNIDASLKKQEYFHNQGAMPDETNDRNEITHKNIGMPDLNSENEALQNIIFAMLTTLKDAGVDGIRWDAAKHIGLPSEGCTFWAKMASVAGLYQYGEILEAPANNSSLTINKALMKEYTDYINVTDDMYGTNLAKSINSGTVPKTNGNWTKNGIEQQKLVYWGESHDSYSNSGSTAWSKNVSQNVIDKTYALVASRAGAQSLYFSRPAEKEFSSIAYARKGSTHFTSREVAAVNHFHNAMIGAAERYATGGGCAYVLREGGAVIVSPNGSDIDVTVNNTNGMVPEGSYTDEISGSTWTVTSTKITGHIGSTGIAVFYDAHYNDKASVIGDVDLDGAVTILDATAIQRHLASLEALSEEALKAADCDGVGAVTILDATEIQRYLVGLQGENCRVGIPIT